MSEATAPSRYREPVVTKRFEPAPELLPSHISKEQVVEAYGILLAKYQVLMSKFMKVTAILKE